HVSGSPRSRGDGLAHFFPERRVSWTNRRPLSWGLRPGVEENRRTRLHVLIPEQPVHEAVGIGAVLTDAFAEATLQPEAGLLQHAPRGGVPAEMVGFEAV